MPNPPDTVLLPVLATTPVPGRWDVVFVWVGGEGVCADPMWVRVDRRDVRDGDPWPVRKGDSVRVVVPRVIEVERPPRPPRPQPYRGRNGKPKARANS